MAGILEQALGTQDALTAAATTQVSPTLQAFDAEAAKTTAAKAEQQRLLTEKAGKVAAVAAEPMAEKPPAPVYDKIPMREAPEPRSAVKTFAQMLPVIAALSGSKTQTTAIAALNAGAAVMDAMENNDQEAMKQSHQLWLDNMGATLKNNQIAQQGYLDVINDRKMTWEEKSARIQQIAAEYGDRLASASLAAGDMAAIAQRAQFVNAAAGQLQDVYQAAVADQRQRQELSLREKQVDAQIANDIAQLEAMKRTVNGEAGAVANKIRTGQPLTAGDRQVWAAWLQTELSSGGMAGVPNFGGASRGAGGQVDISAYMPAEPPAAAAPAPAAASAQPAAPPKAVTPDIVQKAKAALARGASRDEVRAVWLQQGYPPAEFDRQIR